MYIYFYPKENATSSASLTFTRLANFVEIRSTSKWVVMSEKHMLWTCYANISYDLFFFEVKMLGGGGGGGH